MEDVLAILLIFGGGSVFLFSISPIGRAIASRIKGEAGHPTGSLERLQASHQTVLEELEGVRRDLTELQERMDFTERLLAQHRDVRGRLPAGDASAEDTGSI